jgi:hypothetical protein
MQATKLRVNFLFALVAAFLAIYSTSAFAVVRSATVYYSLATKGWVTARIHHNASGAWTAVPGIAMTSACTGWMVATISFDDAIAPTFQAVFNNGSGAWDNPNGGGNYAVGVGTSVVRSGSVMANGSNPCAVSSPDSTAIVYYRLLNGWTNANIHYQIGSGAWTAVPGVSMNEAACTGWAKRTIALGSATSLKAAFNTNGTSWDNNSSQDYVLGSGEIWPMWQSCRAGRWSRFSRLSCRRSPRRTAPPLRSA